MSFSGLDLFAIIAVVLVILIVIVIGVIFIYQFIQYNKTSNKQSQIPFRLAIWAFISVIAYNSICIVVLIDFIDNVVDPLNQIILISVGSELAIAIISFYIFRLHQSFVGSVYKLNKIMLRFLIILTIFTIILLIVGVIIKIWNTREIGWLITLAGLTIVLILYITITVLFAIKLFKLVLTHRVSIETQIHASPTIESVSIQSKEKSKISNSNHKLPDSQMILIKTITKQVMLIILPSFWLILLCIIVGIQTYIGNPDLLNLFWIIVNSSMSVELCIAIWLSFAFADTQYYLFCSKCHGWVETVCAGLVVTKLRG